MNGKIGPGLAAQMDSLREDERLEVHIFIAGEPAREVEETLLSALQNEAHESFPDRETIVAALQESAQRSRQGVENYLRAENLDDASAVMDLEVKDVLFPAGTGARSLDAQWINNSVTAEVSPAVLRTLLERDDVVQVDLVREISWDVLLDGGSVAPAAPGPPPAAQPRLSRSVKHVNAHRLWEMGLTGEGVIVAVVDTGVNADHPDLRNRMWDTGRQRRGTLRNLVERNNDTHDHHGHGTACAGIIAGDGTLGRATGVAPGARIMPLRAKSDKAIWEAMRFAIEHGAHIINMSMSWPFREKPNYLGWRRMCESIHQAGVVHVNSAGNEGNSLATDALPFNIGTPANCPPPWLHRLQTLRGGTASAIACGACNLDNEPQGFSGRGPAGWEADPYADYPYANSAQMGLLKPDICAPGMGTESCDARYTPTNGVSPYTGFQYTSAAAPHVAGCIALLVEACLRARKPIVPARYLEAIENTAKRMRGQEHDKQNSCGAGCIDVLAAYKYGNAREWWE